jgi:hypothetical protein
MIKKRLGEEHDMKKENAAALAKEIIKNANSYNLPLKKGKKKK